MIAKVSIFTLLFLLAGCSSHNLSLSDKEVKKEYFTGGNLRSEFIMDDDTGLNGVRKFYGYEEELINKYTIKNGLKEGMEELYDKEGRVIKRTPYLKGKRQGLEEAYYSDGTVMFSITYENGKCQGPVTKYDQEGNKIKEEWCENGRIVH